MKKERKRKKASRQIFQLSFNLGMIFGNFMSALPRSTPKIRATRGNNWHPYSRPLYVFRCPFVHLPLTCMWTSGISAKAQS